MQTYANNVLADQLRDAENDNNSESQIENEPDNHLERQNVSNQIPLNNDERNQPEVVSKIPDQNEEQSQFDLQNLRKIRNPPGGPITRTQNLRNRFRIF